MDAGTQAYIDRTMDAVRAGNDARFAEVTSRLDVIGGEIRAMRETSLRPWQFVGGLAIAVGSIIAVLAFGGDRFDAGLGLESLVDEIQSQQSQRDAEQDARFGEILDRLDALAAN